MLKKRTRPVSTTTTKQGLMADTYIGNHNTKPIEFASAKSPRKPSSQLPVGLGGIADALKEPSVPESRTVLFGSQLRIQIPSIVVGAADCPQSPIEFGIKNKSSQLALLSPAARRVLMCAGPNLAVPQSLSPSEMELSDDYTCVIAHGPNPRTTRIFDNCIIESCCGRDVLVPTTPRMEKGFDGVPGYCSDDFLTFCHACKKSLGRGKDVFMYRGEKAFCSRECRYHEIFLDDEGTDACSAGADGYSLAGAETSVSCFPYVL